MKRTDNQDQQKIIEMINRCEEIIMRAKRTARDIEEKVRRELEALARNNPDGHADGKPRGTQPPASSRHHFGA